MFAKTPKDNTAKQGREESSKVELTFGEIPREHQSDKILGRTQTHDRVKATQDWVQDIKPITQSRVIHHGPDVRKHSRVVNTFVPNFGERFVIKLTGQGANSRQTE